jgi:hypothetical protein
MGRGSAHKSGHWCHRAHPRAALGAAGLLEGPSAAVRLAGPPHALLGHQVRPPPPPPCPLTRISSLATIAAASPAQLLPNQDEHLNETFGKAEEVVVNDMLACTENKVLESICRE